MNTQHKDVDRSAPDEQGEETVSAEAASTQSDVPASIEDIEAGDLEEAAADMLEEQAELAPEIELTEIDQLKADLDQAKAEVSELTDNSLRVRAEMENIRRRSQNEVVSARKFAIEGFAQELLGVKDSLDQAALVELTGEESQAVTNMQEGLALTLKQLDTALSKFAVNEVEAAPGVKFDPEHHQAISMVPSGEFDSNHIISVMQKGFTLKERLLRPAMVVVAS